MRRALLLGAMLLVLGASEAQAATLSGPHARSALVSWSLRHGMVEARVERCRRLAARSLRCQMVETGWWGNPADGTWVDEMWSVYKVWTGPAGNLGINWLDFVGPLCTTTPGLEPQCPTSES